jgi:hypothetical protein
MVAEIAAEMGQPHAIVKLRLRTAQPEMHRKPMRRESVETNLPTANLPTATDSYV